MVSSSVLLFCRLTIGLTFAWAVLGKLRDLAAFREAVVDFRLLPEALSRNLAWVFLLAECALLLMLGLGNALLLPGFVLSAGLLGLFSVALGLVLRRSMQVSCNCFGVTERRVSPYDVARNLLLMVGSLVGCWTSLDAGEPVAGSTLLLLGLMALGLVILVTNLADVVETLRRPFPLNM
ncbi:MauE/DoxX family redox-associated membrane protein [Ktedonosporobacter rubrisoli]|nr:MauE/DoxX family redox-associated membrane protein [Ktedonosporobacter rubrisoli]